MCHTFLTAPASPEEEQEKIQWADTEETVLVNSDLWEEYSLGTQLNPLYHTGGCSLAIKGRRGEARSGGDRAGTFPFSRTQSKPERSNQLTRQLRWD